jgi:CHASE1-domain containing sensor protein
MKGTYNLGPWQPVLIVLGAVMITLITTMLVSFSSDELNRILQSDEIKNATMYNSVDQSQIMQ